MNERTEKKFYDTIKVIAHVALLTISTLLSINLFLSFSDNSFYQVVWVCLAVTLELTKVYLFMLGKANLKFTNKVKGAIQVLVYIGLAFVSLIASAGFSMLSINEQSFNSVVANESSDITLIDTELEQLRETILDLKSDKDVAREKKANIRADWSTAVQDKIIDEATLKIEENNNRINELLKEKQYETTRGNTQVVNSSDVFSLLGSGILTGDQVMLYLMILLAVLLEVCTALTTGDYNFNENEEHKETTIYNNTNTVAKEDASIIEEVSTIEEPTLPLPKVKETLNKEAFVSYIKALFSEGKDKLVNDIAIAEMTGMKLNHCKSYRRRLQEMEYNGSPLVVGKRGVGSSSDFPLRSILKLIETESERQWK